MLLPDESSIICPDVSFICQSAAFSSTAHAGDEAIIMPAATKNTETKSTLLLVLALLTPHLPAFHGGTRKSPALS